MANKIEDFGKKIGGARKDLQNILKTRSINVSDTVDWSDVEREQYITKKQVWKEPDYQQMLDDGIPRTVIFYIKNLRDSLPAKPHLSSEIYQNGYIDFVADVRDRAMHLRTEDDVLDFYDDVFDGRYCSKSGYRRYSALPAAYGCMTTKVLRAVVSSLSSLESQANKKQFLYTDEEKVKKEYRVLKYTGKNLTQRGNILVYSDPFGTTSYLYPASKGNDKFTDLESWQAGTFFLLSSKSQIVGYNFVSEDAAYQYALEYHKENGKAKGKQRKGKFTPEPLESIERQGVDYRADKDISGNDMLEQFGFRGGEFGNWENQNDRQHNLNYAYDAFLDLAAALDIEPKDISLGGNLSIAFGARGHGSALAHYEPGRNVINLTKMKGAGSLAHEWGHAFDYYVAHALNLNRTYFTSTAKFRELQNALKFKKGGGYTQYYQDSLKQDTNYSRDSMGYWSSPCEMFARAFACYVKDKLAEKGIRSDYLCGHAESSIFPQGEERIRINQQFDSMISNLKEQSILNQAIAPVEPDVVSDFRAKTAEMYHPMDSWTPEDIEGLVGDHVIDVLKENGIRFNEDSIRVVLNGSRARGIERPDSDVDVVVEIDTDEREYVLFNLLHNEPFTFPTQAFQNISIDINPITPYETGTLEFYLPKAEEYLTEKAEKLEAEKNMSPLERAMNLINDFCVDEYSEEADFSDMEHIGLAHTTDEENDLPIQVTADLVKFRITHEYAGEMYDTAQFDSIEDMIENGLTGLDFSDLVSVPDELLEKHKKNESENTEPVFSKGIIVDGVQVYEALAAVIDRGSGIEDVKLRVQTIYDQQHPTLEQLADILKNEYGIRSQDGEGNISQVDYNSQGLIFSFENGEKYLHSWYNVAVMTQARLKERTYLTAGQSTPDSKVDTYINSENTVPTQNTDDSEPESSTKKDGEAMDNTLVTTIGDYSKIGETKLREICNDEKSYTDFLKFSGRIFKHPVSVALEFYAQNPNANYQFIAAESAWASLGYHLKPSCTGLRFRDKTGNVTTLYDFGDIVERTQPPVWTVNTANEPEIKKALLIPQDSNLLQGLMNLTIREDAILSCMEKLNLELSEEQQRAFILSFDNAVAQIIAGRLELGGNQFNIPADNQAFKMLETDEQRFILLSYTGQAAKNALRSIENAVKQLEVSYSMERKEKYDLHRMAEAQQRATSSNSGQSASGNPNQSPEKRSDLVQSGEKQGRNGMENHPENRGTENGNVAAGSGSNGNTSQRQTDGNGVQEAESAERDLRNPSAGTGEVASGGTNRESGSDVDAVHGGTVSGESGMDAAATQLSDSSTGSGTQRNRVSGTTGGTVSEEASATGEQLSGDSGLGTGKESATGTSGHDGKSADSANNAVNDAINQAFGAPQNTETAASTKELTFSEQVDATIAGTASPNTDLKVCDTPQILLDCGCRPLPMLYTKTHLLDAIHEIAVMNPHFHGLSLDEVKAVPSLLEKPAIVLDSVSNGLNGNSSILVFLNAVDQRKLPLMVSVKPNGIGKYDAKQVDANFITSIYGKENITELLEKAVSMDNVLYWNKQNTENLLSFAGIDLPDSFSALSSDTILHESRNKENGFGQKFTIPDDKNGQQPISSEIRAKILFDFAEKHGLQGEVFVRKNRASENDEGRAYNLIIKVGKRFELCENLFSLVPHEYFSEKKLRESLEAFEQSDVFKEYLEQKALQERIQNNEVRIGDRFFFEMRECEVTSLDGLYADDVVVTSIDKSSNGMKYAVTKNVDKKQLLSNGKYLGNSADTVSETAELSDEEKAVLNVFENELTKRCLQLAWDEKEEYTDALFDSDTADRYSKMEYPPVKKDFLALTEDFRQGKIDFAEIGKALSFSGDTSVSIDNQNYFFDTYKDDQGVHFTHGNINRLVSWEELGQLQLQALYDAYVEIQTEAANEFPEIAADTSKRIQIAEALINKAFESKSDVSDSATDTVSTSLSFNKTLSTVYVRTVSISPDDNSLEDVATIKENGKIIYVSENISDADRSLIEQRAQQERQAMAENWGQLSDEDKYTVILTKADAAQFAQISHDPAALAEKVSKYEKSLIFEDEVFETTPDEAIRTWDNKERLYFNENSNDYTWVYFNPDSEAGGQLVMNNFDIPLLREAMQSETPLDYIESGCTQYLSDRTDTDFVATVNDYLGKRAYLTLNANDHTAQMDALQSIFEAVNSKIDIQKYGLSIDLEKEASIDLVTHSVEYIGGLDADGHERRDNFGESDYTVSYFVDNEFLYEWDSNFGTSSSAHSVMEEEITNFLDKAVNDSDRSLVITHKDGTKETFTPKVDTYINSNQSEDTNEQTDTVIRDTPFTHISEETRTFWASSQWTVPEIDSTWTPWGTVEHCQEWGNGIYVVDTERHGGMMIPERLAEQVLTPECLNVASEQINGYYFFEEDSEMWVATLELFDKGLIEKQDNWRDDFYEVTVQTIQAYHPDYWQAREAAFLAADNKAETQDNTDKDIMVTLDYGFETHYFKVSGMTLDEFMDAFAEYEKPYEAMQNLGASTTEAIVAEKEQRQDVYSLTVNVPQNTIRIDDYTHGELTTSTIPLPDKMISQSESVENEQILFPIPEILSKELDSYTAEIASGGTAAILSAAKELSEKQEIVTQIQNAELELTPEQLSALNAQENLLNTLHQRMQDGNAVDCLNAFAEELAPKPQETVQMPSIPEIPEYLKHYTDAVEKFMNEYNIDNYQERFTEGLSYSTTLASGLLDNQSKQQNYEYLRDMFQEVLIAKSDQPKTEKEQQAASLLRRLDKVMDSNGYIHKFSDRLGIDETAFHEFYEMDVPKENPDTFGAYSTLRRSVNIQKAKEYFDSMTGQDLKARQVYPKLDKLMRDFIIEDGFDIDMIKPEPQEVATVPTPLYKESYLTAKENDEIEQYRASSRATSECKADIRTLSDEYYSNNVYNSAAIMQALLEKYVPERIEMLLAVTVHDESWDARYSEDVKEWAESTLKRLDMKNLPTNSGELHPNVHAGLLNLLAKQAMKPQPVPKAEKVASPLLVPQSVADNVLRLGGIGQHSVEHIVAFYQKDKSIAENAEFLKNEFGTNGRGIFENDKRYAAWFDENGITFCEGNTAFGKKSSLMTWEQAAERISYLLENGQYAAQNVLDSALNVEATELAEKMYHTYRDNHLDNTGVSDLFAGSYSDSVKLLTTYLRSSALKEDVIQRLHSAFYDDSSICAALDDLKLPQHKFSASSDFEITVDQFISEDEKKNLLRSYVDAGKFDDFYASEHSKAEKIDSLKNYFGIGGTCANGTMVDYDGKGMTIERHQFSGATDAKVQMNWNEVSTIVDPLINERLGDVQSTSQTVSERNTKIISSIEVGDIVTLNGMTFEVTKMNGDFSLSMSRLNADGTPFEDTGTAGHDFIGNWKSSLLAEAGNTVIEVQKRKVPDFYEIYQLKSGDELHYHRFTDLKTLHSEGNVVSVSNYTKVYEGELTDNMTLESIYRTFNTSERPQDFHGHSLSVSDIVVLHQNGEVTANYVDDVGFTSVPEFLTEVKENTNTETKSEPEPEQRSYSPASMRKQILELNSTENFYENVRKIVGWGQNIVHPDHVIKRMQRIADARFEELTRLEELDKLVVGDHVSCFDKKWAITALDGSFSITLQNLDPNDKEQTRTTPNWKKNLDLEKIEGFGIPEHAVIETQLSLFDAPTTNEQVAENTSVDSEQTLSETAEEPESDVQTQEIDETPESVYDEDELLPETSIPENITDKTPHLRETLNAFSKKHGLGELNLGDVEGSAYYPLVEKYQDGSEYSLGTLHGSYEYPFTPESLQVALDTFEVEVARRGQTVPTVRNRNDVSERHDGISELPPVYDGLPEIKYADNPANKVYDNLEALAELKRLENCKETGRPLYDKKPNQYHSKENSDKRLRGYSGWGGVPQIFDESFVGFKYQRDRLKKLLTPEEYKSARASTLNSHYTSQVIIDAMYKAVQEMGLSRDSRILEPSCGTGNFIARMPHSIGNGGIVGVELDTTTAKIAQYLASSRDNVTIKNCGFEVSNLENNSFDLVIGNVPFGNYKFNDPDYTQDWLIHDAFFRKALDKVAVGGVVAFITSSGTMDKKNPKIREYLATHADLVGAIRLPNNAFGDAGTNVTADIIFLQKREHPLAKNESKPDWCYTVPMEMEKVGKHKDGESPEIVTSRINTYFARNPQMVLGTMKQTTHFNMTTCEPLPNVQLSDQLDSAVRNLHAKIAIVKNEKRIKEITGSIEPWGKDFAYQVQDGKVYYRRGDEMKEVQASRSIKPEIIKELCPLRDLTRELLDKQKTNASDESLMPLRQKLETAYDQFVAKYGNLNSKTVRMTFSDDSDYAILSALESGSDGKYTKADIFTKRTVNPQIEITSVKTLDEALQVSLDQRGSVNIPYMARLLHQGDPDSIDITMQEIASELTERGLIFHDPAKEAADNPYACFVDRAEYLSGNVRQKLAMAEFAVQTNPELQRNIDALKEVQPEDIKAAEIDASIGCTWIDPADYIEFLEHLSGRSYTNAKKVELDYSSVSGEFVMKNARSKADLNVAESSTYGTSDYSMYALFEKLLNQRRIEVKRKVPDPKDPSNEVIRTDPKATKIANEKAKLIKAEFKKWIFSEPARCEKYEKIYNQLFNSLVGRSYDGSHLTFKGMQAGMNLRQHQMDCVARSIYGGNTLVAHVVGAGKSAVIAASVMKKKQLGLINKACLVVPKPLTEQSDREWRKMFPDAKLLVVNNADLSDEKRREVFAARVATGDYDCVIMSQEQFEKMSMSKEYQLEYYLKQEDELLDRLEALKAQGIRNYTTKQIQNEIEKLKVRIQLITNPKSDSKAKDKLLDFETLGFDYLVVDEAHAYKNGFVSTKMTNVAGVSVKASGRADDMQMKCDYFNEHLGDGHIMFATGTPVSNSMTELYVMSRYLRPDLLASAGVARFDEWAATFGNITQQNKQTARGTLQLKTSFSSFKNMPELMTMYKEFADIRTADQLPELDIPKLATGKRQIISVDATPEQKQYVRELAERAKAIQDGNVDPSTDNLLKITGEARLVGLGNISIAHLYAKNDRELPDGLTTDRKQLIEKDSKVDACVQKVKELYDKTSKEKGVQIIFSDIAVNSDNGGLSVYEYIRDELKDKGIPPEEIVFAPKSDAKNREDIFRDINNGKYRVVIASTGTLGTGANIQSKLYALHHLDIPWKPSDFEQREGRILRQGNNYDQVEIFNYVTKGTLDSYLYQTVTDKARFIAQLWNDKCPARVMEDCDEKVLSYGELQAAAEDNPDLKTRIELQNKIAELKLLQTEFNHETGRMQKVIEAFPDQQAKLQRLIQQGEQDVIHAKSMRNADGKIESITVRTKNGQGISLTQRSDINAYLLQQVQRAKSELHDKINLTLTKSSEKPEAFCIGDFKVEVKTKGRDETVFVIKGERDTVYSCNANANANSDNCTRLMNFFESYLEHSVVSDKESLQSLELNVTQAQERVKKDFPEKAELEHAQEKLVAVEERLTTAGLLGEAVEYSDAEDFADGTFENNLPEPDTNKDTDEDSTTYDRSL